MEFKFNLKKMAKGAFKRARHGKKSGTEWWNFSLVQELFGVPLASSGSEAVDPLWTRRNRMPKDEEIHNATSNERNETMRNHLSSLKRSFPSCCFLQYCSAGVQSWVCV